MNAKKIKRFKKSIEGLDPLSYIKALREFKRGERLACMRNNISTLITVVFNKRHAGESLDHFRERRKRCNERRRERDKAHKLGLEH